MKISFMHRVLSLFAVIYPGLQLMGMNTSRDNKYNATTLFGDSEPLGSAGKKIRGFIKEHVKTTNEATRKIQAINTVNTDLQKILTDAKSSVEEQKNIHTILQLNQIGNRFLSRTAHSLLGPDSQFDPKTERNSIIKIIAQDLAVIEELKNNSSSETIPELTAGINIYQTALDREHYAYSILEKLGMPEKIGVDCLLSDTMPSSQRNRGFAIKDFHGHRYIKINYNRSFPWLATRFTTQHEIGHINYKDESINLSRTSPMIGISQITAPFIGYASTAALLKIKNLPRPMALSLGVVSAALYYTGGYSYTLNLSRFKEMRADTFACNNLAKNNNLMPIYNEIFKQLDDEEYINNAHFIQRLQLRYASTHPQPRDRALNCIALLEQNHALFNKEQVDYYLTCRAPENQQYCRMLMKKYLPADVLKKAG